MIALTFNNPLLDSLFNLISVDSTNNEFCIQIKNDVIECFVKESNKFLPYQTSISKAEFDDALATMMQVFQIDSDLHDKELVSKRIILENGTLDLRFNCITLKDGLSLVVRQENLLKEENS